MEQVKFRNALNAVIYCAVFFTICVVLCCIIGIIMTYIFEDARDFTVVFIVGISVICGIWALAGLTIMLQNTVIVTENEIRLCRGKKTKWIVCKSELKECIYNKAHWYDFLMPIAAINAYIMHFKLSSGIISRKKYCSLSLKKARLMRDKFHYPIRNINTVYEQ